MMKKTLCCLLALMLCMCTAWAEETVEETWQMDLAVDVDEQMIADMLLEDQQDLASAVKSVLDHLTVRVLSNGPVAQLEVYLKEQHLLDVQWEERAEDTYMTSSLFPGYVLAEPSAAMPDEEALQAQLASVLKKYVGEPKTGFFPVKEMSDTVFNTHLAVELDDAQLADMLEEMIGILADQMPVEEMDAMNGQLLEESKATLLYELSESGVLLKGDYYTRKNGDYLYLFRLFMGDTALDFLWAAEGDYTTIVVAPCDAPNATRIALNIAAAMEEDELSSLIISMYDYAEGVEWVLASPIAVAYFSHEKIQEQEYGTLTMEMLEEWEPLGIGLSYEIGEDAAKADIRLLTDDYQNPALTVHLDAATCEEGPSTIDLESGRLVYLEEMDEEALLELEQAMVMPLAQLLIDACTAMPDEMALITNAVMRYMSRMEEIYGIIGGADGPTSIYLDEDAMLMEYQFMIDALGWEMQAEDLTEEELWEVEEAYVEMLLTEYWMEDEDATIPDSVEDDEKQPASRPWFGTPGEEEAPEKTEQPDAQDEPTAQPTSRPWFSTGK